MQGDYDLFCRVDQTAPRLSKWDYSEHLLRLVKISSFGELHLRRVITVNTIARVPAAPH